MSKLILTPLLFAAAFFLYATERAPAIMDSLSHRRYLLPTVRVIAKGPAEALSAVREAEPAKGGAISLYEALQGIPGLSNTVGTKEESNLRVRGFRKNEVKVLVNGRPISNGYFGNVDLGNFGTDGLAGIQIVSGPAASIYGNNAMGGVVNLITADPDNSSWAKLSVTARRNNANRFAISSSRRFSRVSYRFAASRDNSEGIVLSRDFTPTVFENGGVRNNQHKTLFNLDGELYYEPDAFHRVGLTGGFGHIGLKRLPSSIYEANYRQLRDWKRYHGTLMWEGILSATAGAGAMLYYDGGGDRYQEFNDPGFQNLAMDSIMRGHSIGFHPHLVLRPAQIGELRLGLRLESKHSTRKDNGFYQDWTPNRLNSGNAYAHLQLPLGSDYSVASGIGFSVWNSDARDSVGFFTEPSIAISRNCVHGRETNLALGRNTAFPTMRQLFSADRGNPALRPQSAWKAELSHFHPLIAGGRRAALRTAVHVNLTRDLIDLKDGRYENIHSVVSYGGEAALLLAPLPRWTLRLDYARLEYAADSDYRLSESPRDSFSFTAELPLLNQLKLNTSTIWTGKRYSQDGAGIYQTLPSYWKHDIGISRKWKRIDAAVGLENILDADYQTEYGYPGPGLDFYLRLTASI